MTARRTLALRRESLSELTAAQLEEIQAAAVTTGTETRNCPTWNGQGCYTVLPLSECHCTW